MLQAWLVLPALFLAYLVAAPAAVVLPPRSCHAARPHSVAVVVVSLSWMSAVSLVPQAEPPLRRRELQRLALHPGVHLQRVQPPRVTTSADTAGCIRTSTWLETLRGCPPPSTGSAPSASAASWARLLHGPFGHDDAWLLLPAVVAAVWLFVLRPATPRTDPLRAAVILWSVWLVLTFGFFSGRPFPQLVLLGRARCPPVAALCGMGAAAAWQPEPLRPYAPPWPRWRSPPWPSPSPSSPPPSASAPGSSPRPSSSASWPPSSCSPARSAPATTPSGPSPSVRSSPSLAMLLGSVLGFGRRGAGVSSAPSTPPTRRPSVNHIHAGGRREVPRSTKQALLQIRRRSCPPNQAADVFETSAATGYSILATGHEFLPVGGFTGRVPGADPPALQAVGRRGPRPPGHRRHQAADPSPRSALGGRALHANTRDRATTRTPKATSHRLHVCTERCRLRPVQSSAERAARSDPRLRKSRNCDTRMKRMMPRPTAGTCWRCGSVTSSGSVSSYSLPPGDQPDGAVGQRVAHPLRVGAVGQGEAEPVLRAEHVDGGAIDGPRAPADVDHDARARAARRPRGRRPCSSRRG